MNDHFVRVAKLDHVDELLVAVDERSQLHLVKVRVLLQDNISEVDDQLMADFLVAYIMVNTLFELTHYEINLL